MSKWMDKEWWTVLLFLSLTCQPKHRRSKYNTQVQHKSYDPRENDITVIQYPTRVQLQKLRPLYRFNLTPGKMVLQKYNTRVQLQKVRPLYTGLF